MAIKLQRLEHSLTLLNLLILTLSSGLLPIALWFAVGIGSIYENSNNNNDTIISIINDNNSDNNSKNTILIY